MEIFFTCNFTAQLCAEGKQPSKLPFVEVTMFCLGQQIFGKRVRNTRREVNEKLFFRLCLLSDMPIIMHKSTTGSLSVPFLHKQSIIWRIPHSFFSADILVAIPRWWFVPVETLAPHYISFVLIQFQPGVKRNAKAQYSHCDYLASLWPCSQQNLHWFHCPAQLQARSGQSSSARCGKNVCCQGMKKNLEVSFFC